MQKEIEIKKKIVD